MVTTVLERDMTNAEAHAMGDHRSCGSGCRDSGRDLREGLGFFEELVAELGDPFTVDERITLDFAAMKKDELVAHIERTLGRRIDRRASKPQLVKIARELDEQKVA